MRGEGNKPLKPGAMYVEIFRGLNGRFRGAETETGKWLSGKGLGTEVDELERSRSFKGSSFGWTLSCSGVLCEDGI